MTLVRSSCLVTLGLVVEKRWSWIRSSCWRWSASKVWLKKRPIPSERQELRTRVTIKVMNMAMCKKMLKYFSLYKYKVITYIIKTGTLQSMRLYPFIRFLLLVILSSKVVTENCCSFRVFCSVTFLDSFISFVASWRFWIWIVRAEKIKLFRTKTKKYSRISEIKKKNLSFFQLKKEWDITNNLFKIRQTI